MKPIVLATIAGLTASSLAAQAIPIRSGLVLDYSHKQFQWKGERQFLVTVRSADSSETIFQAFFMDEVTSGKRVWDDTVSRREMNGSRALDVGRGTAYETGVRNRTIMMLSRRSYAELKRDGQTDLATFFIYFGPPALRLEGRIELVRQAPETLTVIADGKPVPVRALHVRGRFQRMSPQLNVSRDAWFLDDPQAPWLLSTIDSANGMEYHVRLATVNTSSGDEIKMMESALAAECHAPTYGFYFAYNSATIAPLSEPMLGQVATMLKKHGDWTVTIEGHTDSVGGAKYNQELSQRRAQAVKDRLVAGQGIPTARLAIAGIGLARPLASNGTAEGRARNRRVELVRPCNSRH
ncbi:MAG: OmpA family protein [Gemmatimonadaceae bacterium]